MIDLVDNQRSVELSKSEIEDFLPLANKDIKKLCEENERLLVFPHSLNMSNDKIELNPLFVVEDYKKEALKVKTTNNGLNSILSLDIFKLCGNIRSLSFSSHNFFMSLLARGRKSSISLFENSSHR